MRNLYCATNKIKQLQFALTVYSNLLCLDNLFWFSFQNKNTPILDFFWDKLVIYYLNK